MTDLDLPVLGGSSVHGYIYKQSHANTKVWFKRYMLLYKGLLFYWETQAQYEKNFPIILAALANTTLPIFHSLFIHFNDPDSLEYAKKGEMTQKRANKILTSESHFRGLYFVYGHDVKKGFEAVRTTVSSNKVKTLAIVPADTLVSSYPLIKTQSNAALDADNLRFSATYPHPEPLNGLAEQQQSTSGESESNLASSLAKLTSPGTNREQYLHPLSITVIHKDMFRTLDLGFTTDYARDLWFSSFQMISSQLVAPKVLPLLRGLQLPPGIRFGDLRLDEITIFLASNQYTQFDVNEHVLLYYYTGSSQSNPPSDAFTRCILFTTHRIIKIHGNEVPINFSYSEIGTVLFYAKGQDSRRKLGLVNSVRLVCNTNSITHMKDRNLFMSTLRGIKYVVNATAVAVGARSTKQASQQPDLQTGPDLHRLTTRRAHQQLGLNYWYIDQSAMPEIKTMDSRAHLLLQLAVGKVVPLILTTNHKHDSFFANLLSRIVVVRQLFAMNKERYAIGVYNNRLRLWDWSVHRYIALLRTITSDGRVQSQVSRQRQLERKKSFSTNSEGVKSQQEASSSYIRDGILIQQRMAGQYSALSEIPTPQLLPHLISGYIDFSGGAIKLSQNLINIAYSKILHEYYHNGELHLDPFDSIEMNRKIQAVQSLQEFYREDVNYITAGDSGLVVLDIKPIGSIFHDRHLDIEQDLASKKFHQSEIKSVASSRDGLFKMDEFNAAGPILDATPLYLPPSALQIQQQESGAETQPVAPTKQRAGKGHSLRQSTAIPIKKRNKRSLFLDDSSEDDDDTDLQTNLLTNLTGGSNDPNTAEGGSVLTPPDPSLSLANGNGAKCNKYNRAYQYEFVLSEFTGHRTQQWKWNESDLLWPYHSTVVPPFFNEVSTPAHDPKALDDVKITTALLGKFKVGDVYTEEVWQNQRYYPFFRWSENLLPTDRPAWSTDMGVPRTVVEANRELPEGWEWVDQQWSKDTTNSQNSEGWWYGSEFKPGLDGYSSVCNSLVHLTRKRKWVRRRRCVRIVTSDGASSDKLKIDFGGQHDADDDDDDDDSTDLLLLGTASNRDDSLDSDDDDDEMFGDQAKSAFAKPRGKEVVERDVLRRQSMYGPGVYIEYIYENQKYSTFKGWIDDMVPITQSFAQASATSKKTPSRGNWSSEDRQYVVADKSDISPGQGYRWCSQWELDVFVDGDEDHWMYARNLESSITAKWFNTNHVGTSYRRRRWCRYKELVLRNIYLPAPYASMVIKYEDNDTISFADASSINAGPVDPATHTPSKSLLTIKSMFDTHDLAQDSLKSVAPGSLVFLERLGNKQQQLAGQEPGNNNENDVHGDDDDDDDDDDDENDDDHGHNTHKEGLYQRWSILGLDSIYLERVILPFIHLADISKEELKVANSIMNVYTAAQGGLQPNNQLGEGTGCPVPIRKSSVTGYDDSDNSFVKLSKTYGIDTINDLVFSHDYLTYKASEGVSDASGYQPHGHYLSSTFTAINASLSAAQIPKQRRSLRDNSNPGDRDSDDDDDDDYDGTGSGIPHRGAFNESSTHSNSAVARNFDYTDYLTRTVKAIPSGHLSAYLQLWLEQSRAACLFHNVSWVNRVPPPILFKAFHKAMPNTILTPPKTLPPLPFISSYCYQHNLIWSNDYFSVYCPRLSETRPTMGLGDVDASENQFISFGDCIFNNGSEVRSTVYIDHPLLLPPLSFRLVHVLTDDQSIMTTNSGPISFKSLTSRSTGPLQGILNSSQPLLVYEMIPPVGYVALGLVARTGRPTCTHYYRCIPQDFVSIPAPHPTLGVPEHMQTDDTDFRTIYPTPPTSIRLFSNADGYSRSSRVGRVVSGFEKTAEMLTDTILNDDNLFEITQRAKDMNRISYEKPSHSAGAVGDSGSKPLLDEYQSRKQSLHPWSANDIRSEGVSVVDEAIANAVLAEALRDLAQFDHNDRRTDQRSILQNVIEAVKKRRGNQMQSSKIASNALEKHVDRSSIKKDDSDDDDDDDDDDNDIDFSVIIPPTVITNVDEKHRKMLGVNDPSYLLNLSKTRNRKEWAKITKANTLRNTSLTVKPKHNEVAQHALYYKNKKSPSHDKGSPSMIHFIHPTDDHAVVTTVRMKTIEEEELDNIPFGDTTSQPIAMDALGNVKLAENLTGEFLKLGKTKLPVDQSVKSAHEKQIITHRNAVSPLGKIDATKIQAFGIPPNRIKVIQKRLRRYSSLTRDHIRAKQQRSFSLPRTPSSVNDPNAALFGTIFEKKISQVTFPTITLPYFHSNSDLLQPKLCYIHSNIDALLLKHMDQDDGLSRSEDDDSLLSPPDQTSNRLVVYNSVIPKLPTNSSTLALWTLPSGTFTVTNGHSSPVNIRLGMGNVKPMATWCAELFIHAHTIEILLLGAVNKRQYYKKKWDDYQQKLSDEEEKKQQQEKSRLQSLRQKFKKGSSSSTSTEPAKGKSVGPAPTTIKLGNRLYDDAENLENDDDGPVVVREARNDSDDESADDFYDPMADPDEQARREEQRKRVQFEQEKNKKFYDSDDDTINATPAKSSRDHSSSGMDSGNDDDDDDDDRFNFIGDDIGLRKKFNFSDDGDESMEMKNNANDKNDLIEMSTSLFGTGRRAAPDLKRLTSDDTDAAPNDGSGATTDATGGPSAANPSNDVTGFGQKQIIHDQYGNVITTITSYGNNIVIPGVNDDLLNALPTDDTLGHDDSSDPKQTDPDQERPSQVERERVKYEYLSPKKIKQLLPPMVSLVKHYALWIRQLVQHFNLLNHEEYSLPIPCQKCVIAEYQRLQNQIKGTPSAQQLNMLKPFEEYDSIKHYFKYGVVLGNACLMITPHNFDAIGVTHICSLIDGNLLSLCKCENSFIQPLPQEPSKRPIVVSPPTTLKTKRTLYDDGSASQAASAPTNPSSTPTTFTKGHYYDFTPYLTSLAAAPPFLCPMTPNEHLACLMWLVSQTNRLCQAIRVSVIEDLLHVALHSGSDRGLSHGSVPSVSSSSSSKSTPNTASTDQIGSLLSLLIRWESVLDFIPPLTSTDNAICNQLLRKNNCSVPKRDDLILNQPFKTYVYTRCLDLVTTRFVNVISPSLSAWDRVRNTITGVGPSSASRGARVNPSASAAALTGTQSSGRSLYSHLNKREGDNDDDHAYSSVLPYEAAQEANRHGVLVSDADLAAEFAVDLNLTLVDTNTNEKQNGNTSAASESNKQHLMQQLLMTMTSLSQDLLAVHRAGKRRLGIFKLFLFTYNDLFLQIFNFSLHVDGLVLAEKASVGEWLDYYNSLLKSITLFITRDNTKAHASLMNSLSSGSMNQRYVLSRYQELRSLRLVCLDLLHNIRTMRLTYVTEYLNVVKTNINYMFENILMSETSLLPIYQPYNAAVGLDHGQFETHSPTDVYEILHTFCNTMIKQFRLYPIFNQFIGITPTPSTPIMSMLHPPPDAPAYHAKRPLVPFSLRELIIEFGLLHIVMNNQPIDYEVLQDKYLLVSKLFDVLLQAQSYYFSAILLHLDRIYQRVVANKGGIYDTFKPKELQQPNDRKFFARKAKPASDSANAGGTDTTSSEPERPQQIVSILDIPSAMRIFNMAVSDMQKYVEEHKINVKRKQSFGQKLSLQYIFSNSVSSSTASHRIASVITNTSTVSSIPLPHIYIVGHMNNIWDYLNHRQGLVERFQNLSDELEMTQPHVQRILAYTKRSALMICARGSNVSGDFSSTMNALDFDDMDSDTDDHDVTHSDSDSEDAPALTIDLNNVPSSDYLAKTQNKPTQLKRAILKRQQQNQELLKEYSNFNSFFSALLDRESDLVENNIYNLYHKCQDILIAQCCFTPALTHTLKLHSNEWWTSSGMINDWLETHFIFLYNTFIGLQVHPLNVRFVKQYLRKWVKNICYIYISRFLAAFHWDKKRPDYVTHLLRQTKPNDYNFNILLDKLYTDLQAIVNFCKTLETRLPPHIGSKYEEDLTMRDVFKTDTILLSQFLRIAEFDNPYEYVAVANPDAQATSKDTSTKGRTNATGPANGCMALVAHFDDIHLSISGTKYLAEDVVQQIYEGSETSTSSSLTSMATMGGLIPLASSSSICPIIVTMYNIVQVVYSLRYGTHSSQHKSNLQNILGQITQYTNNITQKRIALSQSKTKSTQSPAPMSRQHSLHGSDQEDEVDDDDEDEYESILKHNTLRLHVLVENGRGLVAKNTDGVSSDPYVVVKLIQGRIGGSEGNKVMEKKKTSAITANINPDWYEVVSFNPKNLLFTDSIELSIFDSNWLSRDQSMGTVRISRHSIEQRCIQQRKTKNQRRNSMDQEQFKREEIISNIAKSASVTSPTSGGKTRSAVWGYCTERFALTIPNRGTLTCTFILVEDKR